MLSTFDVRLTITPGVETYRSMQPKRLLRRKKIAALPDWSKFLNHELMAAASAKA
jgi:hypothetical protein